MRQSRGPEARVRPREEETTRLASPRENMLIFQAGPLTSINNNSNSRSIEATTINQRTYRYRLTRLHHHCFGLMLALSVAQANHASSLLAIMSVGWLGAASGSVPFVGDGVGHEQHAGSYRGRERGAVKGLRGTRLSSIPAGLLAGEGLFLGEAAGAEPVPDTGGWTRNGGAATWGGSVPEPEGSADTNDNAAAFYRRQEQEAGGSTSGRGRSGTGLEGLMAPENGDDSLKQQETEEGEEGEEDMEDGESENGSTVSSRESMMLTILIVVGCGMVMLIILCLVRKIMDLCLLRRDPTGAISYSQEEGLSKTIIERLPQMRYKKQQGPVQPPKSWGISKRGRKKSGSGDAEVASAADGVENNASGEGKVTPIPGSETPPVAPESTAGVAAAPAVTDDGDSTADMCAICLVEYEIGEDLRVIPGCKHRFHKECIDPWLETKAVCAYCKVKVEAKKTCCGRVWRSLSDRTGLHLVAPNTIHFSSSRRTYTNQDVQFAMGPSLPSSYGHSEMDYVGSMVARRSAPAGGGVESGEVRTANLSSNGTRDGAPPAHVEGPQGSIVVQPVSAPSFVVAQRDGSLNGAVSGATAGVSRGRAGVAVSGEENETAGRTRVVEGASRPARGSWRRASDGLGGVVFGGDTPEFKEAEAEAAAVVGIRGQRLRRGGPGHVRECTV